MEKNKKTMWIVIAIVVIIVIGVLAYYAGKSNVNDNSLPAQAITSIVKGAVAAPSCGSNAPAASLIASGYTTSASQGNTFILAPNVRAAITGGNGNILTFSAAGGDSQPTVTCGCPAKGCKIIDCAFKQVPTEPDERPQYQCTGDCYGDYCNKCVGEVNNPDTVAYSSVETVSFTAVSNGIANGGFTIGSSITGSNGAKGTIKSIKTILGQTVLYIAPTNTIPFNRGNIITQANGVKNTVGAVSIANSTIKFPTN